MEISNALDAENTEQDVSAAGESLENLAENEGGGGDNALEELMDQHSQVIIGIPIFFLNVCTSEENL